MRGRHGFGYAIDYDRAIAADLAEIADAERCLERGWLKPDELEAGGIAYSLADHVLASTANAASLGMDDHDRACLADALEYSEAAFAHLGIALETVTDNRAWYRHGDALARRVSAATGWSSDLRTRERVTLALRKARASLARHRRNKSKYS